jgi:hypothetical protein
VSALGWHLDLPNSLYFFREALQKCVKTGDESLHALLAQAVPLGLDEVTEALRELSAHLRRTFTYSRTSCIAMECTFSLIAVTKVFFK